MSPSRAKAPRRGRQPGHAAPLFAALGDTSRLALLERLSKHGPASVTALSEGAAITRQAVSKHIHVLEDAGIIKAVRSGRDRLWELRPDRLTEGHEALDAIAMRWDAAIDRLRALVEG